MDVSNRNRLRLGIMQGQVYWSDIAVFSLVEGMILCSTKSDMKFNWFEFLRHEAVQIPVESKMHSLSSH